MTASTRVPIALPVLFAYGQPSLFRWRMHMAVPCYHSAPWNEWPGLPTGSSGQFPADPDAVVAQFIRLVISGAPDLFEVGERSC